MRNDFFSANPHRHYDGRMNRPHTGPHDIACPLWYHSIMSITLRAVREDDLANIIRWRTDPDITRYMNTDPVLTMESQKEWLASVRDDITKRHWLIEVDGEGAGVIQLIDIDWKNKTTSWGYYVGEKRLRSMKLALSLEMSLYDYVFDALGFEEIHNEAFSLNEGVIKLHQMCGNEIVKVVPGEIEKEGVQYDVTHMSLTREKWYALRVLKRYEKIDFDIVFRFHHIGYAVADIVSSQRAFRKTGWRDLPATAFLSGSARDAEQPLPINTSGITADEGRGVYLAFMERTDTNALIELVSPMHDKSPVSKTLASSNGVASSYHICYEVDDLDFATAELKRRGYVLTDTAKPAPAFGGRRVAFLLHKDAGLIEILEAAS